MMKKIHFLLIFSFVFSVMSNFSPSIGYASCAEFNIEEALKNDDAIFSGKVIKIQPKALKNNDGGYSDLVLFEVESIWKGLTESQVIIQNDSQFDNVATSIDFNFEIGENYLVYAYKWESPYLQTNECKGTKLLTSASEDLAFLGEGEKPTKKIDLESELETKLMRIFPYVGVVVIVILGIVTFFIWRRARS